MRLSTTLAGLLLGLALTASAAGAQVLFHDDFNGTAVDFSKWTGAAGNGALIESGGTLGMYGPNCGVFPVLFSKTNPFPLFGQPFRFTMRHRYIGVGPSGIGMDWFDKNGGFVAEMWQDASHTQYFSIYGNSGWTGVFLQPSGANTAWHDFVVDYCGGKFSVSIDGVLRFEAESCNIPTTIAIGNYAQPYSCSWSAMEFDDMQVERLNTCTLPNVNCPTPTAKTTWGRLKSFYR